MPDRIARLVKISTQNQWIPAFAGMTHQTLVPSFPRRRESHGPDPNTNVGFRPCTAKELRMIGRGNEGPGQPATAQLRGAGAEIDLRAPRRPGRRAVDRAADRGRGLRPVPRQYPSLLMRAGGRLQSPALEHLTTADVVLMCVFVAAAALLAARCSLRTGAAALLATLAGSALLGAALTDPPVLTVYEQYARRPAAARSSGRSTRRCPSRRRTTSATRAIPASKPRCPHPGDRTHWSAPTRTARTSSRG